MQVGTDVVHRIWDELRAYDVPISAFWLLILFHCLKRSTSDHTPSPPARALSNSFSWGDTSELMVNLKLSGS
ncbi:hypothetical protein RIF29_24393 [Crotalaria pallida]|uniref:Uncharacterized protein n=1 Tax=Crotalaria pallida TaxID=3830 RepID=A0AAN9I371_CROPI